MMYKQNLFLLAYFSAASITRTFILAQEVAPATELRKHCDFFDRNNDGIVTLAETEDGLEQLGLSNLVAQGVAAVINNGIALFIQPDEPVPDGDNLDLNDINQAIHDSDTGIFDVNGNFRETRFNNVFDQFDVNNDGYWSSFELEILFAANFEGVGSAISRGEFTLLNEIAGRKIRPYWWWKKQKSLSKSTLKEFYLGTLFYKLADEEVPFE